ncbi:MAG: hypothetical protein CVU47_04965 [Chloroflexi bacterium HGW-Chloroflexi-9]|nr:MAG: hypothetical protein CVU47_04965 [Chloroflexi bacterium HGW-Chloroflexi-9]
MLRIASIAVVAILLTASAAIVTSSQTAEAHPGNTDSSGCHTCRTNCPKWGLSYGQYHCHNAPSTPRPAATTTPRPTATQPPPAPAPASLTQASTANSKVVAAYMTTIRDAGTSGQQRRSDCVVTAIVAGPLMTNGTNVEVQREGTGRCSGWSIVLANGATSWIRNLQLTRAPSNARPTATASPTPRAAATPSPASSAGAATWSPSVLTLRVVNASTSGWQSTDGTPLVPAWTSCSVTGEHHGYGFADGVSLQSIGTGTGGCSGWYLFVVDGEVAWLPTSYLSASVTARPASATAPSAEYVTVLADLSGNEVLVQRNDGALWLLDYGTGCLSMWRYEGRTVTILNPGSTFAGVGSEIALGAGDGVCRIWSATSRLERATATPGPEFGEVYLVRANGEVWLTEILVGCLSLSYATTSVVVQSSGLFAGIGTEIIVLDNGDTCSVWDARRLP